MARIRSLKKTKSASSSSSSSYDGLRRSGSGIRDNVPLKSRPVKGSPEAKEKMARLRAMRKKRGAGFWDDLSSTLIHTGIVLGQVLGGTPGAMIGNIAADVIGNATGRGLSNTIQTPYGQHVDGIPNPVVSKNSKEGVKKHGFHRKQRGVNGLHISGGSFLQLG